MWKCDSEFNEFLWLWNWVCKSVISCPNEFGHLSEPKLSIWLSVLSRSLRGVWSFQQQQMVGVFGAGAGNHSSNSKQSVWGPKSSVAAPKKTISLNRAKERGLLLALITQKPHRKCPCHPLKRFTSLPPQIKGVVWKHFAWDKGRKINIICGFVSPISWPCVSRCLCLSWYFLLSHSLFPFPVSCFFSSKVCFWRKQRDGNRLSLVVAFFPPLSDPYDW